MFFYNSPIALYIMIFNKINGIGVMPLTNPEFVNNNATPVYTSAKDIGNMAAGYVAGVYGLTWEQARAGFDGLQKLQEGISAVEKPSSQNAQHYGFARGQRRLMINNFEK